MIITIVNMSKRIADAELQRVVRAVNRQIREDFEPYWSLGATLRLEGKSKNSPDKLNLPDMRGDAVLYVWDKVDVPGALGYHDANARGIPYGFVFTDLEQALNEAWTTTLSHEALELIADPLVNLLVAGPHPSEDRTVFHWYEMSDAVQGEAYTIDGVEVSNFVLPLYFTPTTEVGSRNDFLGIARDGETLPSFGINPGGYIGFFDPLAGEHGEHVTFSMAGDTDALKRLEAKRALSADGGSGGRRGYRIAGWPRERALAPASRGARAPVRAAAASPPAAYRGSSQAVAVEQMATAVSSKCKRRFEQVS
ncbi:hypothetical protein HLB44_00115 [Aquincola sp. S2]|uniref:Uncharacterized protein n=1 Tax=Pseudaquabacterium terrae TaxID=2732868 RepID=A0ABX2E9P7_9BURK|nr:hypothetical protein [Aquabacterium terrae]NRF65377.1 hypothetical protein [Aquabacterium terrae]